MFEHLIRMRVAWVQTYTKITACVRARVRVCVCVCVCVCHRLYFESVHIETTDNIDFYTESTIYNEYIAPELFLLLITSLFTFYQCIIVYFPLSFFAVCIIIFLPVVPFTYVIHT